MTKKLRIKANELKKKEDYLKQKQVQIQEKEDFWKAKKEEIRHRDAKNRKYLDDYELKIDIINRKELKLQGKQTQVKELEK